MLGQLENPLHYKTADSDPSENYVSTISGWSNKWLHKGQIDQDVANWVVNTKARPGKAFGTIKTYKEGNPLRLITSCCGTTIENLSAFTEFYLKPLAQTLPSFVKATTHLKQKIEDLNIYIYIYIYIFQTCGPSYLFFLKVIFQNFGNRSTPNTVPFANKIWC